MMRRVRWLRLYQVMNRERQREQHADHLEGQRKRQQPCNPANLQRQPFSIAYHRRAQKKLWPYRRSTHAIYSCRLDTSSLARGTPFGARAVLVVLLHEKRPSIHTLEREQHTNASRHCLCTCATCFSHAAFHMGKGAATLSRGCKVQRKPFGNVTVLDWTPRRARGLVDRCERSTDWRERGPLDTKQEQQYEPGYTGVRGSPPYPG